MELKEYRVDARLTFRLSSHIQTEGEIQAQVRELMDSLGLGGALSVIATEEEDV